MKLARQATHLKKCINGAKDNNAAIIINPSRPIPPKVPQGHISNLMIISLSPCYIPVLYSKSSGASRELSSLFVHLPSYFRACLYVYRSGLRLHDICLTFDAPLSRRSIFHPLFSCYSFTRPFFPPPILLHGKVNI